MTVSNRVPKILFVHPDPADSVTSFIRQDSLILQKWYAVEEFSLHQFKRLFQDALKSRALWQAVARSDAVFAWFGWCVPAILIAKCLGKPSVIVGGGADVVSIPEISYGLRRDSKLRLYLWTLGYRLAKRTLMFSESSRGDLLKLLHTQTERIQTLHLGVDSEYFKPGVTQQDRVLTVSYISENNMRRKGLQTVLETARITPEIPFRLGGKIINQGTAENIRATASANVAFLGYLDGAQLVAEYQSARIYAQLSLHEGFGMALAEAMACECVPVVTERGAIPEVVGDAGIYVPVEDPRATSSAIRQIIADKNNTRGKRARQRIADLFPVAKREQGLKATMEAVL